MYLHIMRSWDSCYTTQLYILACITWLNYKGVWGQCYTSALANFNLFFKYDHFISQKKQGFRRSSHSPMIDINKALSEFLSPRYGFNTLSPSHTKDIPNEEMKSCNYLQGADLQHSENLPVHANATRRYIVSIATPLYPPPDYPLSGFLSLNKIYN